MAALDLSGLAPLTLQIMQQYSRRPAVGQGIIPAANAPQTSDGGNRRDIAAQGLLDQPAPQSPGIIDAFTNPTDVSNRGLVNLGLGLATGHGITDSIARGIQGYQQGVDQGNQLAAEAVAKQNQLRQQRIENAAAAQRMTLAQNADAREAQLQPYKIAAQKAGLLQYDPQAGGYYDLSSGTPQWLGSDPNVLAARMKQLEAEGRIKIAVAGASARASAANTPTHYQSATVLMPDGTVVGGRFDPLQGQLQVKNGKGEYITAPDGARQTTEGAGGVVTANQFNKLEQTMTQQEIGLNQLTNYAKTAGGMSQGIDRWVNAVTAKAKTLFSSPLDAQEFNQQIASGQLQGLLGALRLEVMGPGVLTEQDAQRIVNYLGGDPASALQNPEVVKAAIARVVQDKMVNYVTSVRQYNRAASSYDAPQHEEIDFMSKLPQPTMPAGTVVPQPVPGYGVDAPWTDAGDGVQFRIITPAK